MSKNLIDKLLISRYTINRREDYQLIVKNLGGEYDIP